MSECLREDLLSAIRAAGFGPDECDDRDIRNFVKEELLEVVDRRGQGGSIVTHAVADRLRLPILLQTKRPRPVGLGLTRFEAMRHFLGDNSQRFLVDNYLPAIAYIVCVPGADVKEARRAAIQRTNDLLKDRGSDPGDIVERWALADNPNDALVAMAYIHSGTPAYQEEDIYSPVEEPLAALWNRVGCRYPGFDGYKGALTEVLPAGFPRTKTAQLEGVKPTPRQWASQARAADPSQQLAALSEAADAILADVARAVLVLTTTEWDLDQIKPGPVARFLLNAWVLITTGYTHNPDVFREGLLRYQALPA